MFVKCTGSFALQKKVIGKHGDMCSCRKYYRSQVLGMRYIWPSADSRGSLHFPRRIYLKANSTRVEIHCHQATWFNRLDYDPGFLFLDLFLGFICH